MDLWANVRKSQVWEHFLQRTAMRVLCGRPTFHLVNKLRISRHIPELSYLTRSLVLTFLVWDKTHCPEGLCLWVWGASNVAGFSITQLPAITCLEVVIHRANQASPTPAKHICIYMSFYKEPRFFSTYSPPEILILSCIHDSATAYKFFLKVQTM